ncbi:ATP-binding cassette domain-containing protein, partial [bacterium]|nr:ATP-binding cassette domain-containing protein [bacterium]
MLEVSHLSKTYGSGESAVAAVRDVTFSMAASEFAAIVGPSGSGKTTLLAMIGGLLTPSSGSIRVNGREIAQLSSREAAAYRRDSVGYV